jgi:calcineurin-like phosphoesterase family protein
MTIFFTADQHYGHRNVISHDTRPFRNVQEMEEVLIENHNSVVMKDDIVYNIGDFGWNPVACWGILPRLNGTQILILGNHDRHSQPWIQKYRDMGFAGVCKSLEIDLPDPFGKCLLAHYPLDHPDDSPEFKKYKTPIAMMADKKFLIHGHIHKHRQRRGNEINVGVPMWNYFPVSLSQLSVLIM